MHDTGTRHGNATRPHGQSGIARCQRPASQNATVPQLNSAGFAGRDARARIRATRREIARRSPHLSALKPECPATRPHRSGPTGGAISWHHAGVLRASSKQTHTKPRHTARSRRRALIDRAQNPSGRCPWHLRRPTCSHVDGSGRGSRGVSASMSKQILPFLPRASNDGSGHGARSIPPPCDKARKWSPSPRPTRDPRRELLPLRSVSDHRTCIRFIAPKQPRFRYTTHRHAESAPNPAGIGSGVEGRSRHSIMTGRTGSGRRSPSSFRRRDCRFDCADDRVLKAETE